MRPSRIFINVDLPAPLAPTSPVTPGATDTVRPSSAVTSPGYTLVSTLVSMTAPVWLGPAWTRGAWMDGMCVTVPARDGHVIARQGDTHSVPCGSPGLSLPCGVHLQDDAPAG